MPCLVSRSGCSLSLLSLLSLYTPQQFWTLAILRHHHALEERDRWKWLSTQPVASLALSDLLTSCYMCHAFMTSPCETIYNPSLFGLRAMLCSLQNRSLGYKLVQNNIQCPSLKRLPSWIFVQLAPRVTHREERRLTSLTTNPATTSTELILPPADPLVERGWETPLPPSVSLPGWPIHGWTSRMIEAVPRNSNRCQEESHENRPS